MESFWRRVGVETEFLGPEPVLATQNGGFASRVGGGMPPPPQRRKNEGLRNADPVYVVLGLCVLGMGVHAPLGCDAKPWFCVLGMGVLAPPWLRRKTMALCHGLRQAGLPLPKTRSDPRTIWYMSPL